MLIKTAPTEPATTLQRITRPKALSEKQSKRELSIAFSFAFNFT